MSSGTEYVFLAPVYDAVFEPLLYRMREAIVSMIPPDSRVLEVGCGTGAQAVRLRRIGTEYTGVDLSMDMLRRARKKKIDCIEADGRHLPYDTGEFDAATISLALHEMDPEIRNAVTAELLRILRPGGMLVVADYKTPGPGTRFGSVFKKLIHGIERLAGGSHYRNYIHFMSDGGLLGYLRNFDVSIREEKSFFRDNMAVLKVASGPSLPTG
jgi:ubiquinone/menaquinone biosynthesis C-methylase UbiE